MPRRKQTDDSLFRHSRMHVAQAEVALSRAVQTCPVGTKEARQFRDFLLGILRSLSTLSFPGAATTGDPDLMSEEIQAERSRARLTEMHARKTK
jgi:hypothetical protein